MAMGSFEKGLSPEEMEKLEKELSEEGGEVTVPQESEEELASRLMEELKKSENE